MTDNNTEQPIRRIIIILGSSDADPSALEAVIQLASGAKAEVCGLFIEDINILNLAQLPFLREFSFLTATERHLEPEEIERQLRIQALAARRALELAARSAGLPWSFRTVRGSLTAALLEAAMDMDLMLIGAARRNLPYGTLRTVAETLRREGAYRPITVVFEGSMSSQRALATAGRLAAASRRPLTVFLVADSEKNIPQLREKANERLGGQPARLHPLIDPDIAGLLQAVRSARTDLLVLGAGEKVLEKSALNVLLKRLSCPALLVR